MESWQIRAGVWAWLLVAGMSARAETAPPPGLLLSRYTANLEREAAFDCRRTALDIEAALPRLSKRGRLQAIRRFVPGGKPEYKVVQTEGDATVRQQVIARYLTAEARAETMPSGMVAVTPQNYKFRFAAAVGVGKSLAYVFHITPRHKRVGLLDGELWIDVSTATAVRKAGRMVKSPSAFLSRVDVIQDTDIQDGHAYLRITRLDIHTRLVGRAELRVAERVCQPEPVANIRAGQSCAEPVVVAAGESGEEAGDGCFAEK